MSPLTAKLKCPHGNGKRTYGAEAVAEVAFDQDALNEEIKRLAANEHKSVSMLISESVEFYIKERDGSLAIGSCAS